jgi:hypothetical protein
VLMNRAVCAAPDGGWWQQYTSVLHVFEQLAGRLGLSKGLNTHTVRPDVTLCTEPLPICWSSAFQ